MEKKKKELILGDNCQFLSYLSSLFSSALVIRGYGSRILFLLVMFVWSAKVYIEKAEINMDQSVMNCFIDNKKQDFTVNF